MVERQLRKRLKSTTRKNKGTNSLAFYALKEKGEMEKVLTLEAGDWEDKTEKKVCL